MYDYIRYASPVGTLILASEDNQLTVLVIEGQKYEEKHLAGEGREQETAVLKKAGKWLDRYFDGKAPDPEELPLSPKGTDFQKRVWKELLTIPYGRTDTYGAIAKRMNSSARAVGTAVGHNPISIIIPCHRVLGADGSLTGYAGGVENKKKLLKLESGTHKEEE